MSPHKDISTNMYVCEETHMTAPETVRLAPSFFCWVTPENVVGIVTGREIMRRQRLQEREWENDRKIERQKKRKRLRAGSESQLMWKCLESPRASPLPPRSVSLYLFHPFFRSHLNSSPSASIQCDVGFWSSITTEMRQSRPTQTHWTHTHAHIS